MADPWLRLKNGSAQDDCPGSGAGVTFETGPNVA